MSVYPPITKSLSAAAAVAATKSTSYGMTYDVDELFVGTVPTQL